MGLTCLPRRKPASACSSASRGWGQREVHTKQAPRVCGTRLLSPQGAPRSPCAPGSLLAETAHSRVAGLCQAVRSVWI